MGRPEHLSCVNTAEGIQRINENQACYDKDPERYEHEERQEHERQQQEQEQEQRQMQEQQQYYEAQENDRLNF